MKGFDLIAISNLIKKRNAVSKLFGPFKTKVREELAGGTLAVPAGTTKSKFIDVEAKRRTHAEIRENDEYAKFRDEYDAFHPDASSN